MGDDEATFGGASNKFTLGIGGVKNDISDLRRLHSRFRYVLSDISDQQESFDMTANATPLPAFDAGSFRELAESELGLALWAFLNAGDNLIRMETATYLERPAVQPLSPGLLVRFGEEVRQDRIKQMIGRMARQVMESHGYRIDRQNVRIPAEANVFSSGTRYIEAGGRA
jgi:hypothetical protein